MSRNYGTSKVRVRGFGFGTGIIVTMTGLRLGFVCVHGTAALKTGCGSIRYCTDNRIWFSEYAQKIERTHQLQCRSMLCSLIRHALIFLLLQKNYVKHT